MFKFNLHAFSIQLSKTFFASITRSWQLKASSSQRGVSSMMVLILVVLLLIVGWEIGQFAQRYTESGREIPPNATGNKCIGSNTTFDCYDQDEGTDFTDTTPAP
jgi:hypothetical protein